MTMINQSEIVAAVNIGILGGKHVGNSVSIECPIDLCCVDGSVLCPLTLACRFLSALLHFLQEPQIGRIWRFFNCTT